MKSLKQLTSLALGAAVILGASTFVLKAATNAGLAPSAAYDQDSIQGKVTAKTDSTVTVDAKMVATSPTTAVSKNGKAATLADVNIGDKVKVTAKKSEDGGLQAVMIEVSAKPGDPYVD
jgi:ribosomal protein S1